MTKASPEIDRAIELREGLAEAIHVTLSNRLGLAARPWDRAYPAERRRAYELGDAVMVFLVGKHGMTCDHQETPWPESPLDPTAVKAGEDFKLTIQVALNGEASEVSADHDLNGKGDWPLARRAFEAAHDFTSRQLAGQDKCPAKPSMTSPTTAATRERAPS